MQNSSVVTPKCLPKLTAASVHVQHEALGIIENGFSRDHSYASRTHNCLLARERSIRNEGKMSENGEFIWNFSTNVHIVVHKFWDYGPSGYK